MFEVFKEIKRGIKAMRENEKGTHRFGDRRKQL